MDDRSEEVLRQLMHSLLDRAEDLGYNVRIADDEFQTIREEMQRGRGADFLIAVGAASSKELVLTAQVFQSGPQVTNYPLFKQSVVDCDVVDAPICELTTQVLGYLISDTPSSFLLANHKERAMETLAIAPDDFASLLIVAFAEAEEAKKATIKEKAITKWNSAIARLERASEIRPKDPTVDYGLFLLNKHLAEYYESIEKSDEAQKHADKAEASITRATKTNPTYDNVLIYQGNRHLREGREADKANDKRYHFFKAIAAYESAIEVSQENTPVASWNSSLAYQELASIEEAARNKALASEYLRSAKASLDKIPQGHDLHPHAANRTRWLHRQLTEVNATTSHDPAENVPDPVLLPVLPGGEPADDRPISGKTTSDDRIQKPRGQDWFGSFVLAGIVVALCFAVPLGKPAKAILIRKWRMATGDHEQIRSLDGAAKIQREVNPNVAEKQSTMAFQRRLFRFETPIWVLSADFTLHEIWRKDANRGFTP